MSRIFSQEINIHLRIKTRNLYIPRSINFLLLHNQIAQQNILRISPWFYISLQYKSRKFQPKEKKKTSYSSWKRVIIALRLWKSRWHLKQKRLCTKMLNCLRNPRSYSQHDNSLECYFPVTLVTVSIQLHSYFMYFHFPNNFQSFKLFVEINRF